MQFLWFFCSVSSSLSLPIALLEAKVLETIQREKRELKEQNEGTMKNASVDQEASKQELKSKVGAARDQLRLYQMALMGSDKALVMQGWNKALAFKTAYSKVLLTFWRLLCCETSSAGDGASTDDSGDNDFNKVMQLVKTSKDPIAQALLEQMFDAEELLLGLMDGAICSLCPAHQTVQREAYRSIADEATLQWACGEDHVGPLL